MFSLLSVQQCRQYVTQSYNQFLNMHVYMHGWTEFGVVILIA